jgi:hypothetical protein
VFPDTLDHLPHRAGGDGEDDQLIRRHQRGRIGRDVHGLGDLDARQIAPVLADLLDVGSLGGGAREQGYRAVPSQQHGQRRAPRPGADHGAASRLPGTVVRARLRRLGHGT